MFEAFANNPRYDEVICVKRCLFTPKVRIFTEPRISGLLLHVLTGQSKGLNLQLPYYLVGNI